MKKILVIILLIPIVSYGQKKVPVDLLSSPSILMISTTIDDYDDFAAFSNDNFKRLNIEIIKTFHVDENPTLRLKTANKIKEDILSLNSKYIYNIESRIINTAYGYVISIMDTEGFDTSKTKIRYVNFAKNLDELFKKFEKDLKKIKSK